MSNNYKVKLKPGKLVKKGTTKNLVPKDASAVAKEKQRVMDTNANTKVMKVLRTNLESNNLTSEHMPFASRFLRNLIREQEESKLPIDQPPALPSGGQPPIGDSSKSPKDFTPESDKQAFDKSLEPETDKGQFDTQGISPNVTSQTIKDIKEWSEKLGEFASFLNDPSTESLHKILANGDRAGSLLRGVTRKASDSITRIAGEVEKLKEILNTYVITAPKKLRDTEQQTAGWTQY